MYVVGGAIRDEVLGREYSDIDLVLEKDRVEKLAYSIGKEINAPVIKLDNRLPTYRIVKDKYIIDLNGLRGKDIIADLRDRDFTINAIACKIEDFKNFSIDKVIDPFDGIKDIKKKIIKVVDKNSISNDPLRSLRGIRFAAELCFNFEAQTKEKIKNASFSLVAKERIHYELIKIFSTDNSYLQLNNMIQWGLFTKIFPGTDAFLLHTTARAHTLMVYHTLERFLNTSYSFFSSPKARTYLSRSEWIIACLKLAALFHDIAKPEKEIMVDGAFHYYGHDTSGGEFTERLLRLLKFSTQQIEMIKIIVERHMHLHLLATSEEVSDRGIRKFIKVTGKHTVGVMLMDLADGFATAGQIQHLLSLYKRIIDIMEHDERMSKFKPFINGYDLIDMGLKPSPLFKELLEEIREQQLEESIKTRKEALNMVYKMLNEKGIEVSHVLE